MPQVPYRSDGHEGLPKNTKPIVDKRTRQCTITSFRGNSRLINGYKLFSLPSSSSGLDGSSTIPKKRPPSAVELRLGHFLGGSLRLGTQVCQVLVKLDDLVSSILKDGFETSLRSISGTAEAIFSPDLIYCIALAVTVSTSGIESELLRKSVQEVFLEIAGADADLTRSEFGEKLDSFLRRRGAAGLTRRFLSLHVFNTVWFQTGDSFRSLAWTPKAFVSDMERVERACQQVVQSSWRVLKISGRLDGVSAGRLIEHLSNRLTRG
jgi:hypothetical protein